MENTFKIQYKGVWLEADVKRGSRFDGKQWVYTKQVRHAGETITDILDALALCQIDRIIEKELNT